MGARAAQRSAAHCSLRLGGVAVDSSPILSEVGVQVVRLVASAHMVG